MEQVRPDMRGISTLLNPQHVDPNIDLKKEEQKVLLKDNDVVSIKSTSDKNLKDQPIIIYRHNVNKTSTSTTTSFTSVRS